MTPTAAQSWPSKCDFSLSTHQLHYSHGCFPFAINRTLIAIPKYHILSLKAWILSILKLLALIVSFTCALVAKIITFLYQSFEFLAHTTFSCRLGLPIGHFQPNSVILDLILMRTHPLFRVIMNIKKFCDANLGNSFYSFFAALLSLLGRDFVHLYVSMCVHVNFNFINFNLRMCYTPVYVKYVWMNMCVYVSSVCVSAHPWLKFESWKVSSQTLLPRSYVATTKNNLCTLSAAQVTTLGPILVHFDNSKVKHLF